MPICKKCGAEKEQNQMAKYRGEYTDTCHTCRWTRDGTKKPKSKRERATPESKPELVLPPGGHGFSASITEENALLISQENPEAEADNIVLTRHEARALFEKFGDWAAKP